LFEKHLVLKMQRTGDLSRCPASYRHTGLHVATFCATLSPRATVTAEGFALYRERYVTFDGSINRISDVALINRPLWIYHLAGRITGMSHIVELTAVHRLARGQVGVGTSIQATHIKIIVGCRGGRAVWGAIGGITLVAIIPQLWVPEQHFPTGILKVLDD